LPATALRAIVTPRAHASDSHAPSFRQLNENFLPIDNAVLEQNVLVLNTGDRLVLFDTGMGSLKLFGRRPASS
jgi:hypothetical protein